MIMLFEIDGIAEYNHIEEMFKVPCKKWRNRMYIQRVHLFKTLDPQES
jgi:hypothetical protein